MVLNSYNQVQSMIILIKISYFINQNYLEVVESDFCILSPQIILLVYKIKKHSCNVIFTKTALQQVRFLHLDRVV